MPPPRVSMEVMGATSILMAQFLTLAGLIGGTVEYCEIVRRRAVARRLAEQERLAARASGLNALVRVFLAER